MFSRLSDKCKRESRSTKTDLENPLRKSAYGQKYFLTKLQQCGIICVRIQNCLIHRKLSKNA